MNVKKCCLYDTSILTTDAEISLKIIHVSALMLPIVVTSLGLFLRADSIDESDYVGYGELMIAAVASAISAIGAILTLSELSVPFSLQTSMITLALSFGAILIVALRIIIIVMSSEVEQDGRESDDRSRVGQAWECLKGNVSRVELEDDPDANRGDGSGSNRDEESERSDTSIKYP